MRRLVLPLLLVLFGCSSYPRIDAGGGAASTPGVTLNVTSIDEDELGFRVALELRNDSTRTFEYEGDGQSSLETHVQLLTDAAWADAFTISLCVAPETLRLAPGKRIQGTAFVFGKNRLRRVRVGVRRGANGEVAVWSPVIDLATKKWGVKRG